MFGRIGLVSFLFALFFSSSLQAQDLQSLSDEITDSIVNLQQVEQIMTDLQNNITNLENALIALKQESKEFTKEFLELKSRLEQFKKRYEKLLILCKKLRKDLEVSSTVAWIAGSVAVIATAGFIIAINKK